MRADWIPAYAGMTGARGRLRADWTGGEIPAYAGMTGQEGAGSRLRGNDGTGGEIPACAGRAEHRGRAVITLGARAQEALSPPEDDDYGRSPR